MARAGAGPRNGREGRRCESACHRGQQRKAMWIVACKQWCESRAKSSTSRAAQLTRVSSDYLQEMLRVQSGKQDRKRDPQCCTAFPCSCAGLIEFGNVEKGTQACAFPRLSLDHCPYVRPNARGSVLARDSIDPEVMAAKRTPYVAPIYPDPARVGCMQGTVVLHANIETGDRVVDCRPFPVSPCS